MKQLPLNELAEIREQLRAKGKTVVTTNGAFDILHVGHVRYLQEARALGDALIVGVNSDASVKRYKSPKRPIVPQDERAEMLSALSCVDYVIIFDEDTPEALLGVLQPDIHVKAGDYTPEQMPETKVVEAHGGRVHIAKFIGGKSTTNIIAKIQEAER